MKITRANAEINIANDIFQNHISNRYKLLGKKSLKIEDKFSNLVLLSLLDNFDKLNEKQKVNLLNNFNYVW